jgi:hypothetical protein
MAEGKRGDTDGMHEQIDGSYHQMALASKERSCARCRRRDEQRPASRTEGTPLTSMSSSYIVVHAGASEP